MMPKGGSEKTGMIRIFYYIGHFLYSLTPWAFWVGAGFINEYIYEFSDVLVYLVVVIGLIPLFVPDKIGLNPRVIYCLTAAYPLLGFFYIWFFE